jgi:argonaute-like protein implicated in RNA metabolism and viral defense
MNKILLANQRWPFVLADRLHADVTIGIDVKNNTAGLVIVGSNGGEIRSLLRTSRYKEQLYGNQLENLLIEILRKELTSRTEPLRKIVIHRDGRTFPSEIEQAKRAIELLQRDGSLDENASLTILEIPKSSPTRLRMFEVFDKEDGREWVENPQVGYYRIVNDAEGYLCSTGRAFPRPGTVQPLHVRRVYGNLPLEQGLEDIYYLTVLTWTRPEDCTRYPITIKLNDRYLSEDATEYDEDALEKSIASEEDEE